MPRIDLNIKDNTKLPFAIFYFLTLGLQFYRCKHFGFAFKPVAEHGSLLGSHEHGSAMRAIEVSNGKSETLTLLHEKPMVQSLSY